MIQWPRRRETRHASQNRMVDLRLLELETAKQILEEVFHAGHSDVEDMIRRRLEDESRNPEMSWQEENRLWPLEFCASE
ncbi:Uncharacterised protein [uncultured archaeon]|nr:Uncharacterised protein [uncultured archaeon]